MSSKLRGKRPTDIGAALSLGDLDDAISSRRQESKPRTAAGEILAERRSNLEAENANLSTRLAELQEEVQRWSGSNQVVSLDPAMIEPSRFANRLDDSFLTTDFAQFRAEIRSSGGNVQPIKVAAIPGSNPQRYTIVFGHRRHRACLEEGIKVNAIIENLTDTAQFIEMERENRGRRDLSAYEQGVWYLRACTSEQTRSGAFIGWGLFNSKADLAAALGLDKGNVSKACQIAELPEAVLNAFPSRNEIQFNWATALQRALKTDPGGLIALAAKVAKRIAGGEPLTSREVFEILTVKNSAAIEVGPSVLEVSAPNGRIVARVIRDKAGRTKVEFDEPLSQAAADKLSEFLATL